MCPTYYNFSILKILLCRNKLKCFTLAKISEMLQNILHWPFMNVCNKLECLSMANLYILAYFVDKVTILPHHGAPERRFAQVGFGLSRKTLEHAGKAG